MYDFATKSIFLDPLTGRGRADALAEGATLARSDGKRYLFRDESWVATLELARKYGWQPAGTALPNVKALGLTFGADTWDGRYCGCKSGSPWVGKDDADALGNALLRASDRFDRGGRPDLGRPLVEIAMFV